MKFMRVTFLIFVCFTLLIGCSSNKELSNKKEVSLTISAAASLSEALTDIKEEFIKENPDINLVLNFGGSGSLMQQIKQGAPVDVFFSAAELPFQTLLDAELIDREHQSAIIGNSLTLVTPKEKPIDSLESLENETVKKIAIGTPDSVPAGMYAKQSLISTGIWENIESKLVMAKNVRQVLTYVETGNVDAGFVYNTDAANSESIHVIEEIQDELHDPIIYPAGVVTTTKHKDESVLFFQYLQSSTARTIFKKYGFRTLE